jgi:hypothetical protein
MASQVARRAIELLALSVSLVAGYLYLEELSLIWLFWLLSIGVSAVVIAWHGRCRLRRMSRRVLKGLRT